MSDRITAEKEGNQIVKSGTLVCPSPLSCDVQRNERFEEYVERHSYDHGVDLTYSENAERNLGLWCFYFDHKYIWGNPTMTPLPFWELHSFVAEWNWNTTDLEMGKPVAERTFQLPIDLNRRESEYRRMKQIEVPRNCEKTSLGARAYSVFRSKHEYFVNDRVNYRIIIRSATGKNTRDTLAVIRRMSTQSRKIKQLYGIWMAKCDFCASTSQHHERFSICRNEECGKVLKKAARRIALVNQAHGAGGFGSDTILYRWLTDAPDADAIAAYSIWVAGLESETTGQRPDLYIWDDPQTDKNSDTPEKRAKIAERFDDSVRQLEIPGQMLVFDTRKFADDFAGQIQRKPLDTLFFTLHRRVRWPTNEPDSPPYVVKGYRYYYPIKGNGAPALDAKEVEQLERQMLERKFSAEYMNDPLDPAKALFKREHFQIIHVDQAPIEVRYGLGRSLDPKQQSELTALGLQIFALNSCDPASKEEQSVKGDDSFIVALRTDRYGSVYITQLRAGKWTASRTWDEIDAANSYNRPEFTDFEMPNDEKHVRASFEKWTRERIETLTPVGGKPVSVMIPMKWSHMPKSGKDSRIEQMEQWTKYKRFHILSNAADADLIEKYIAQWVGYGVSDHDDGPDATSRLISWLITQTYRKPDDEYDEPAVKINAEGAAVVPMSIINEIANAPVETGQLWGQRGW